VKIGGRTDARRHDIETVFRRYHVQFELRTSADEEVCYDVKVPLEVERDRVTDSILKLDPKGHAAVDWSEKKTKPK
jgi:hypothetical protein